MQLFKKAPKDGAICGDAAKSGYGAFVVDDTVNSVYGDSMSGSWEIRAQIYGELQ